jgi:hypothetical protein
MKKSASPPNFSSTWPKGNSIRFYLIGYDEVRVLERESFAKNTSNTYLDLFGAANQVMTELRQIMPKDPGAKP